MKHEEPVHFRVGSKNKLISPQFFLWLILDLILELKLSRFDIEDFGEI